MRDVDIALPKSSRAAWTFLIVAGVVSIAFGALLLAADFEALIKGEDSGIIGFLLVGMGLFLSCFGGLVGFNLDRVHAMRVGPTTITIEDPSGDRVSIPWSEVERVQSYPAQGDNQGWVVTLSKRDGGLLELIRSRDRNETNRIVSEMEDARGEEASESEASAPEAHLANIAGVSASRLGDGLELAWNASVPFRQMLFFGPVFGMATIIFGFHREQGGIGTMLAMAFMGLMAGLIVASTIRLIGVRQRVHIDGRELSIEKRRRNEVVEQKSVPTFSIVTVDYTHHLTVIGAQLNLRTAEARDNKTSAMDELHGMENPNPVRMAKAFSSLMKQGVQIPLGGLSLPAKIAVDLALSAEVARRTGKSSGAV